MKNIEIKNIKDYRYALGLTQEELAEQSGLTRATINKLENHRCKPSLLTCKKLAIVFDISLTDLWFLSNNGQED